MFDQLKKKLSNLIKSFANEEKKEIETAPQAQEARPSPTPEEKHEAKSEAGAAEMVKLSLKTKIKGVLSRSVTLGDSDISNFLENLKVLMLESDVSYTTTEAFLTDLEKELRSSKFDSKRLQDELANYVRAAILNVLSSTKPGMDIYAFVQSRIESNSTPVKILFLGPNGTGKTTTIAKIAYKLKQLGMSSVFSASDTFRAAAIEQTEHHAKKVGSALIKSRYGADPASVAFDAIAYAKAHGINVVLIDTAGRQETNRNLVSEMTKIARVAQPDITLFIGESTAGNAIAEQIKEFSKFIKIDGIILTKLDCDAKGGNALSIASITGIPVLFFGTGESYDSLTPYDPNFIANAIIPNN